MHNLTVSRQIRILEKEGVKANLKLGKSINKIQIKDTREFRSKDKFLQTPSR